MLIGPGVLSEFFLHFLSAVSFHNIRPDWTEKCNSLLKFPFLLLKKIPLKYSGPPLLPPPPPPAIFRLLWLRSYKEEQLFDGVVRYENTQETSLALIGAISHAAAAAKVLAASS